MSKTLKIIFYSIVIGIIVASTSLGVPTVDFNQSPFWLSEIPEPLLMLISGVGLFCLASVGKRSMKN